MKTFLKEYPFKEHKQIPYTDYFHESMSKEEASAALRNKVEGTFLIRSTMDGLRLSRLPHKDGSKINHFILHKDEKDHYFLSSQKKFFTIEDLVENYQRVDKMNKYLERNM